MTKRKDEKSVSDITKIDDLKAGVHYFEDYFQLFDSDAPNFGLKQVKEKIRGIIDGGYIQSFTDMDLWQLFSTAGLLNRNSKYAPVFEKLAKMSHRNDDVVEELKKWSGDPDDKSIPLSGIRSTGEEGISADEQVIPEGGTYTTGDYDDDDPLNYDDSEFGKYNLEKKLETIFLSGESWNRLFQIHKK